MNLKLMMGAVALGCVVTGGSASAATFFTDHAAWLAAVSGVTTHGFEGVPAGTDDYLDTATYSGPGFTLDPEGTTVNALVDPLYSSNYDWNSGDVYIFFSLGTKAEIAISAGANFGFFFGVESFGGPSSITIGSTVYSSLPVQPTFSFFGVTGWTGGPLVMSSSNLFLNLTIIDNFSVARSASGGVIPEPSTWMLMILGFGLIARQIRQRHQASVAV